MSTFNVKAYGAVGNGVTDDTAAITSAIAALVDGSELYFPAGTYLISASAPIGNIFEISKKWIKVFGDGIGESTIKIADGCAVYEAIFHNGWEKDVTGLGVCDLTFDHNIDNNPIGPNLLAGGLVYEGTWNGGTTYHVNDIVLQPDTWSYYKCITQHANHEPPGTYWTFVHSEIIDYPEISVSISLGDDLHMHDLEFINSSSCWHLLLENMTGVTIEDITCSNVGDDPNHIEHDTSCIYTLASDVLIQNCDFTAASEHALAAETAIETHGSNTRVQNCTITDFHHGMNITGIAHEESSGIHVTGNHFVNLYGGIWIWSATYPGDPAPGDTPPPAYEYGINGLEIDHNDIDIACATDANERFGIAFYAGNTMDVNDVNIHDNTVSMSAIDSVASDEKWFNYAIGSHTQGGGKASNLIIADNVVTNFSSNAIRFQYCDIQNVTVTGNTFVDCASALPATSSIWNSPILVHLCTVNTLTFSGNTFIDDVPVTRIYQWFYLIGQTSCTELALSGNTYSVTGDKVAFVRPIKIDEDISQPLITENIADFVPPTHEVDPASTVIHGLTTWTVDETGMTWTSTVVDWNDVIDLPQITVTGLSAGNAVRLYDSAENVLASAVESGGTATLTYTLD